MDKREIFDALDDFSQNLMLTLAEVEAIKKNLKSVIEENTVLRLENDKLRERLGEVEKQDQVKVAVKDARILNGFIWMVFIYAQTSMVKDEIMTKKNAPL